MVSLSMLTACQTTQSGWQRENATPRGEYVVSSADNAISPEVEIEAVATPAKAQIFTGRPTVVRPAVASVANSGKKHVIAGDGDIVLSFADTPVRDVLQIILGDYLNEKFAVAADVDGLINLNNQGGLRKSDLIPTLEALLSSVNARLIREGEGYRVVRGARESMNLGSGNLDIIPLRYIDAGEFAKILGAYQVASTVIERGNLLAISGPAQKLKQVRALARSFDINWLQGMSIGMFPVENADAATIRQELLEMFGNGIDRELAGALRIVAVERSNSIMVISAQRDYVQMMGDWVGRLDRVGDGAEQKFFVYRVQNGRASDLAELLRNMFADSSAEDLSEDAFAEGGTATPTTQNRSNFRVIADESTNSLIVSGSPHYYKLVRKAMAQLDSTPLQVLVEARIMELTLTDDLRYGLEWFLQGSRASSDTSARLDFDTAGIGANSVPGFSYLIERAGEVRVALNALADDSRLKVLSSPSLMVLNNQTASILVGDEVPIPTRQATSNISPDAPTVNEIEYRNTGILLTVSPRVNTGGMVTMDISQEVSSVVNNTTSQIDA
ncbi:MAG: hypothetical protein KJP04_07210, partial [Arenicella sp.]|nr:hypothetical protein [Arenicella sp.]